jgi:hypothetical protein
MTLRTASLSLSTILLLFGCGEVIVDADGDGTPSTIDCDDNDASLNDLYLDGDGYSTCDGDCDDGDAGLESGDSDGDGYSTCDGDCDDGDAFTYVGAAENEYELCARDYDGDGWGDPTPKVDVDSGSDCDDSDALLNQDDVDGDGYSTCEEDCDDGDSTAYVGVAFEEPGLCAHDDDGDGWGDAFAEAPLGVGTDCDDGDAKAYVGVALAEPSL